MKGIVRVGIAAAVVVGLFGLGAAPALATHVTCRQVITESVKLTNDITNCPPESVPFLSAPALSADDVTIDLNGHTISSGAPFGAGARGVDNFAGYDGLTVKNGTISNFEYPILINGGADNTVTKMDLEGRSGVVTHGVSDLLVTKNAVRGGNLGGIVLDGIGSVTHNVVTRGGPGILAKAVSSRTTWSNTAAAI
jgi:hypothetical protein